MKIIIVSEKWCDCDPAREITNSEQVLWGSLEATELSEFVLVHFDELITQGIDPESHLIDTCLSEQPDFIVLSWFAVPDSPFNPSLAALHKLKYDLNIPVVALFWDSLKEMNLKTIAQVSPYCDYVFCMDSSLTWKKIAGSQNVLPFYTPNSTSFFCDEGRVRDIHVSFLGSQVGYPDRQHFLRCLKENEIDVYVGGGQRETRLSVHDYASVLKRSRITLNFTKLASSENTFQLKGRIFETFLCNSLLIQNFDSETPKLFKPFVDYIPFHDEHDLVTKINYFLFNEDERKSIALSAHKKTAAFYSGKSFWEHLINLMKAKRRSTSTDINVQHKSRVHCAHPWYGLIFSSTGHYGPCCFIKYPLSRYPESHSDLVTLWNSPEMVQLRKQLVSGNVINTECDRCYDRFFTEDFDITGSTKNLPRYSKSADVTFEQYADYSNFQYQQGRIILAATPLEIYFAGSTKCNIRCTMCGQDHKLDNEYPIATVRNLINDVGINRFDRIGFIGGEPLITKDGNDFIELMSETNNSGTCVYLTTNGTFIHKHLNRLKKIENLFLTVSLDGIGQNYEKIRVGAKYETVHNNLALISSEYKNITLNINSICMKSTLPDVLSLLEVTVHLKATIFFSCISGNTEKENFFENIKLIPNIKIINEYLTNAMQSAEKNHSAKGYHSLLVLKMLLNIIVYADVRLNDIRHSNLNELIIVAAENCMKNSEFQTARELLRYNDSIYLYANSDYCHA